MTYIVPYQFWHNIIFLLSECATCHLVVGWMFGKVDMA